jgi:serine/threonine protein kinase
VNDAARALIGRTLGGRFKLTSFIGEGAMAAVFRGEQSGEPRYVAVKVMHRGLAADSSFLKRFQREARAAARIDHRNTVRILEMGCDRDVVYIAMELCSGPDLFEVLSRERRLTQGRAARIVVQVCAALDVAHKSGVVHRDLKPENVVLLRDPEDPGADLVKVLDFGIAKLLEKERPPDEGPRSRADSVITLVGTVVGTPEYMSPEQARGVPPVDARSDIYACGVLLYQLVTGKLPFRGDSPIEVILQHIERAPAPPSSLVPGLHPGLERTILRALAKWPAERHGSAAELGAELTALLPELPGRVPVRAPMWSDPPAAQESAPTMRVAVEERALAFEAERPSRDAALAWAPPAWAPPSWAPPSWAPSPWAKAPPAPDLLARSRSGSEILGARWWLWVIALAVVCAAIWLTRLDP